MKKYTDSILKVDSVWADLNSSTNLGDRVYIEDANIMSHEQQHMCVTEEMNDIVKKKMGPDGTAVLDICDIFDLFGYIQDRWRLSIVYTSHSDILKKKSAKTYRVVYDLSLDKDMKIHFPPYPVSESAKVGFKVPKIKAVEAEAVYGDTAQDATEFAGLRVNFYQDCIHKEVVKSYMEDDAVVITTKAKYVVGPVL